MSEPAQPPMKNQSSMTEPNWREALRESLMRRHRKLVANPIDGFASTCAQKFKRPEARYFSISISMRVWVIDMANDVFQYWPGYEATCPPKPSKPVKKWWMTIEQFAQMVLRKRMQTYQPLEEGDAK
jgi:hypothetical protein